MALKYEICCQQFELFISVLMSIFNLSFWLTGPSPLATPLADPQVGI